MLNAAEAIVLENGARHLTLDAVASRAGVRKGGLLYHFPTKEALLRAMLEGLGKQLDEAWKKKCKGLKDGPGREIKAFILSFYPLQIVILTKIKSVPLSWLLWPMIPGFFSLPGRKLAGVYPRCCHRV